MVHPDRSRFNRELAPELVARAGLHTQSAASPSKRFAAFESDDLYVLVAGPGEERKADLALAYGLAKANGRHLTLILPEAHALATHLRMAWLREAGRYTLYTYRSVTGTPEKHRAGTQSAAIRAVSRGRDREALEADFHRATLPYLLEDHQRAWVRPLVDWVSQQGELDPAHRRGERAWHCRGQKVLRLQRSKTGHVRVDAGIQNKTHQFSVKVDDVIAPDQMARVVEAIEEAIALRLDASPFHRADEHWFQAVLRRHTELVGLELRALREVPAWRPKGRLGSAESSTSWGRGYIDLIGIDGHGTVQIVETKLATNNDPMFVLQGLDYLAYCKAYEHPIKRRLDISAKAPFEVQYVLGAQHGDELKLSRFAPHQFSAIDDTVEWSLRTVTGWFQRPARERAGEAHLVPKDEIGRLAAS